MPHSDTASTVNAERLERLRAELRRQINTGYIHGAAMRVSRYGDVIFEFVEGYADKAAGRSLERNSVFVTMSTGKPFTALLALGLVEKGLLRLHTPVADVIPEFGRFGKEGVSLYHLMTHTSGLMGGTAGVGPDTMASIEKLTAFASGLPLDCQPGERVNYSMAVAHSVIAAMCLRADGRGRTFARMLDDEVFGPMVMRNTSLGPRDDLLPRLCPVRCAQDVPYNLLPNAALESMVESVILRPGSEFPAAGYLTTIDDLHRFSEMLRRGGELDGVRLISSKMLDLCARNYSGDMRSTVWDPILSARHWQLFPANIGIGFRVRGGGIIPGPFGMLNSPGTFGHFGAGSTGTWVDPERGLSYSLLTTGLLEESHNLERTALLSDMVVAALES